MACALQSGTKRCHAAIHHVGRRDDVGARLSMHDGLPCQHGDRLVVHHIAAGVDQAILTVAGIRVQRDVGDDAEFGKTGFQRGDGTGDQTIGVERFFRAQGFQTGINNRKQRQRGDAQLHALLRHRQQQINR